MTLLQIIGRHFDRKFIVHLIKGFYKEKKNHQIVVKYFKESEFARVPEQTTEGSAGYDLYAADTITFFAPKSSNYSTQFKVGYS